MPDAKSTKLNIRYWFIPFHQLAIVAELVIAVGLLFQILQAWVPDRDDKSRVTQIHRFSVYLMGTATAIFLAIIALSLHGQLRAYLFGAASVLMVVHAALLHTHKGGGAIFFCTNFSFLPYFCW